jgi:myo-inositol-1-phosphate synthase
MPSIRLALVGVGNCASALVQGIHYYAGKTGPVPGLMRPEIGGYAVGDLEVAAAFDIDRRKVGKDVSEAIFARPNCAAVFHPRVPRTGVTVLMGRVLDGVAGHTADFPEDRTFMVSDAKEADHDAVVRVLKDARCHVMLNYLPVGSEAAARFYAECAIDAGVALVNCIPVFLASSDEWAARFKAAGLPVIGDDVKSQLGATIVHRRLADLITKRGVTLDRTYQLNTGGNTDFLNMLSRKRLASKRISKTEAVQSALGDRLPDTQIHVGPSDYVAWQEDRKNAFIRLEGRLFGDVPFDLELRLSVEDSPNSAGVTVDAVRCCKLALDRKIAGPLIVPSAVLMKHPPRQFSDDEAFELTESFIQGD